MIVKKFKRVFSLVLILAPLGCSFTPDVSGPTIVANDSWGNSASQAAPNSETVPPSIDPWWESFRSPRLTQFITEALAKNADIQASMQRVEAARAEAKIAGAPLLPSITYSGDIRQNNSTGGSSSQGTVGDSIVGQVGLSYELDLWGRIRSARGGALALVDLNEFDYRALRLLVSTDTAQAFTSSELLNERIELTKELVNALAEILEVVEVKHRLGALSGFEVAQQRVLVQDATASLQVLERQRRGAQHQLAALLGIPPQELLLRSEQHPEPIDVSPPPLVLPSEVIQSRPDILREEARIQAANFDVGVVRAAYFPRFTVGVSGSLTNSGLAGPWSRSTTFSEGLLGPIFQGGAIEGAVERAEAFQREALERYRQTVLTALREVEDNIVAVDKGRARWLTLQEAETSAKVAYEDRKSVV